MTNLINKYKGEEKMQNLQNELQMLGMDNFQVGNLITIDPNLNDPRHFGGMRCGGGMMCGGMRCGGMRCGGFRCGGFRCFGCFGCFGCGGCGGCGGCYSGYNDYNGWYNY
ncbi:heterocycloanthracin/sonorensin family bacteriocin [Neobacillus novalis]|uniref:Heterocycloanthracin/sonorensin family bacteriocin n=2 Tax=Neobacillus novalis TaxID=220687 RepID=A0AA95SBQ0_9BACI|nr:heterocycloanthracin/sonorensin family bacteriocin [Neobacillus novalis]WHY87087.1 heterocycloanthracin/sonorensin family bacteriocin [Neobacillus novalis]